MTNLLKIALISIILLHVGTSRLIANDEPFEKPPILAAKDILPDSLIEGPHHKVMPKVPVYRFGYKFTLVSDHGEMDVWSKQVLNIRIRELAAIEKLNAISQTQAFATSIAEAAKSPIISAWNVVSNPVSTIKGLPSGADRYLKGTLYKIKKGRLEASEQLAKATKAISSEGNESGTNNESLSEQATRLISETSRKELGLNKAKLVWAKRLKVDPYSDNKELQKALERIALATALGSFAADATIPSYAPLNYTNDIQDLVWETPPLELERQNDERLKKVSIDETTIREFHNHPHYSLTAKTALALAISNLEGVKGVSELIEIVLAANDPFEAVAMIKICAILSNYHELDTPLSKIEIRRGMITAIDNNDTLIFPLAIEYLHWTPLVQEIADDDSLRYDKRELWISGQLSPNTLEQLSDRGWETTFNCFERFRAKER